MPVGVTKCISKSCGVDFHCSTMRDCTPATTYVDYASDRTVRPLQRRHSGGTDGCQMARGRRQTEPGLMNGLRKTSIRGRLFFACISKTEVSHPSLDAYAHERPSRELGTEPPSRAKPLWRVTLG